MTNEEILQAFYKVADAKNWHLKHSPKNLASAVSIEAAELLELFLWDDTPYSASRAPSREQVEKISEELADITIYTLVLADKLGIDIKKAIQDKVLKNNLRFLK